MTHPLSGITVVSIEQAVSAPFATRQLADLGARVIKIERPGVGDFARHYDETVLGLSSHFVWLNRSKESVELDLKNSDDLELLLRIIRDSDVFVHNLAPGVVDRLGLSVDRLGRGNERLIYASISGYGDGGSYGWRKAYDLLVQCEAGLISVTGTPDTPSKVGISIADIAAGMYCFSGILTALHQRERTGRGAHVAISMLEALGEWMGFPMYYGVYGGKAPARMGASHSAIAPYGPFRCGGGATVFFGVQSEREWRAFCTEVLRDDTLADASHFASNSLRAAHVEELRCHIEKAFAELSADEVTERLDRAGIAQARLRDVWGFHDHPQLEARQRWRTVETSAGPVRALLPPATFVGTEPVMGKVPDLGEHNDEVRAEWSARDDRR